jgi:hypothetical protein
MSLLIEVAKELLGMFLTDARLTIATLILVAAVGLLLLGLHVAPMLGGGLLLVGSLVIVIEAAVREARRRSVR